MSSMTSGSQTVGPFFRIGLEHLCARGEGNAAGSEDEVTIRGRVIDGAGNPVPDAMLEIWHADGEGRYSSLEPNDRGRAAGFTRAATGSDGCFAFSIRKPGAIATEPECRQGPHVAVLVFARGLMRHLLTRMYFPDEPANGSDPVLLSIPEQRRRTLIAQRAAGDAAVLEWNVVLQGEDETVFFAW